MRISAVIHTYNSEKYLEECLQALTSLDETVICDMHSTDKTIEIAQKYGCKIVYHENVGFADPARNFALSHATGDWILVVDSDEIIPKTLIDFLREYIKNPDNPETVYIPRKNYVFGKFMRCIYPNCILRFFKKGFVAYSSRVHCTPDEIKGREYYIDPKREDLAIIHYNYDSIEQFIARSNRYTTLELEKFTERGIKFSLLYMILRAKGEFIKRFILKKGYKDGLDGFMFALLLAIYELLCYAKLWEYEKNAASLHQ
ncbi:MAG: glycosyltransferase family 2 protein [Candidatus Gastranaerophilales bacterium]|nr:glycosyltransferase family 2 protein [Candidatus Gastranaerophilales bacterium]